MGVGMGWRMPDTFPKASSRPCSQPSRSSPGQQSSLVESHQVGGTSGLLHSLDVDALDGLFDIIQEGLALWRVLVLRVVVHIG